MNWPQWRNLGSRRRNTLVTSNCGVALVWLVDTRAVGTYLSDEGDSLGKEGAPRYIDSKFGAFLCPYSELRAQSRGEPE
jgi:hypothetical protein